MSLTTGFHNFSNDKSISTEVDLVLEYYRWRSHFTPEAFWSPAIRWTHGTLLESRLVFISDLPKDRWFESDNELHSLIIPVSELLPTCTNHLPLELCLCTEMEWVIKKKNGEYSKALTTSDICAPPVDGLEYLYYCKRRWSIELVFIIRLEKALRSSRSNLDPNGISLSAASINIAKTAFLREKCHRYPDMSEKTSAMWKNEADTHEGIWDHPADRRKTAE